MTNVISIRILIGFIILIAFDAAQQKYYVDTFALSNETISYGNFFVNHFQRWLIWGILSIPLSIIIWKKLTKRDHPLGRFGSHVIVPALLTILVSIMMISLLSMYSEAIAWIEFPQVFTFFFYQKGMTYLMATVLLILFLFYLSRNQMIGEQEIEIMNLKRRTSNLQEALHTETPHLNVKTGHKLTPVALEDIIWIQSDDYCVKIHTNDQTFVLRKSLKSLQEKLAPYRFIRIHRTALLNLNYLKLVNLERTTVQLMNKTEIPLSKTGIKTLKKKMKDVSL